MDTRKPQPTAIDPKQAQAADTKPGAAVDIADSDTVNPALVKQYTGELNNNPRNTDL